ncbi:MAG: pilus assembly protein PilM, partial [Cyanobacteria bacterium P01_H01_bin.121]
MVSFFKNLLPGKKSGIGVELTPDRLNLVQLRKQGQGYKVAALVSEDMPENVFVDGQIQDSEALIDLLQTTLSEHKIQAKRVATAISGRDAVTRMIALPADLSDPDLHEMVHTQEAGLYLPFPRDEADVDYQKLNLFVDEDGIEKVNIM